MPEPIEDTPQEEATPKKPWWKDRGLWLYVAVAVVAVAGAFVLMYLGNRYRWSFAAGVPAGMLLAIMYSVVANLLTKLPTGKTPQEEPPADEEAGN